MNKEKQQIVTIIGFPIDLGSGRRGVDMGPSALRIAGLEKKLDERWQTNCVKLLEGSGK